jgi:Protein of unknown function (DUF1501)
MRMSDASNRRGFLAGCAPALLTGGLALRGRLASAALREGGGLLAPRAPHFPARATSLIIVTLTGGLSHVDSFDHKPKLQADDDKTTTWNGLPSRVHASPFAFRPAGRSGLMVSELFPEVASVIDDVCVIRSMRTDHPNHAEAILAMHTGSASMPLPGIGPWISHGLGTKNSDLPPYVILAAELPYSGALLWDSSFLPACHQGTRLIPGAEPIPDLRNPIASMTLREMERAMLERLNDEHLRARRGDDGLRARMEANRTAVGMMERAPEAFDLSLEGKATLRMYGIGRDDRASVGWQCLVARRLIERGVRVVEVFDTGANMTKNWDAHVDVEQHRLTARAVDRPIAALIRDLKAKGMAADTLVLVCTEFGRAPAGRPGERGRNHHNAAFTCLLAGAGVKAGCVYGETDEYGLTVTRDLVHVHDLHATILHLMGLDHTRLTYRFAGRDFRLTDVHGHVVRGVLE